jgi:hypothetical protein
MTFASLHPLATRASGVLIVAALLSLDVGNAMAQSLRSMSCSELWYERNAIYAEKGYCFETRRAIREFGPACFPPYGELSRREQRRVNDIREWERRKGCN